MLTVDAVTRASPVSASATVNLPLELIELALLVSASALVSDVTVATSFVPVMLTVTVLVFVLSWLVTVNVSTTFCPAVNSLCAELAT